MLEDCQPVAANELVPVNSRQAERQGDAVQTQRRGPGEGAAHVSNSMIHRIS